MTCSGVALVATSKSAGSRPEEDRAHIRPPGRLESHAGAGFQSIEMAKFLDMRAGRSWIWGYHDWTSQTRLSAAGKIDLPWQLTIIARDAGFFLFHRLTRPGHARCVVRDAELSLRIQHDNATMAIQSLFQIVHGFLRRPLRQISCGNAVGRPLGQHQFHDWLAPTCGRGRRAQIIRVTTAADQRRIAQSPGSLIQGSSCRRRGRDISVAIEGHRSYGIVRDIDGANKIVSILRGSAALAIPLIFAQPFHFTRNHQFFVLCKAQRHAPRRIFLRLRLQNIRADSHSESCAPLGLDFAIVPRIPLLLRAA